VAKENLGQLNRTAEKWLREAKEYADPGHLHLLTLAAWGIENGADGEWPAPTPSSTRASASSPWLRE
jgi:hypothetical protein